MKNYLLIAAMWLLLSAVAAFGQNTLIGDAEYGEAVFASQRRLESISYRKKTLTKRYENGKISGTVTVTEENLPPGKFRELTVEETGGAVKSREKIVIEDFEYSRIDNGEWKKYEKETIISVLAGSEVCRQYGVEDKLVGNQSFRVFSLYRVRVWEKKMTFENFRFFIDKSGMIQRSEVVRSEVDPANITSETVTTYDYNPGGLKIEAPVK